MKIDGVSHSYVDGQPVLSDVDLALTPGEHVALVGTSGAGKPRPTRPLPGVGR